jgi:outer membrane protein TolC
MKLMLLAVTLMILGVVNAFAEEETTSLEYLVEEALQNNPEIKAAKARWDASTKRPSQEGSLPDPMIGVTWRNVQFDQITLTEDTDSMLMFSFFQEFPFPGKLSLKEKIASEEANAEEKSYEATTRKIVAGLKEAYYDWYLVDKTIELTKKNKELLQGYVKIAEAKYEVGMGIQQDVLKAQVELSKFIEQLEILDARKGVVEARLRSILNRPDDSPLGNPEALEESTRPLNTGELYKLAQDNAPLLKMREKQIDREEQALNLAMKEYYPDFAIEAGPGIMGMEDNGVQGVWEVTLGLRVPLYFWRKQRFGVEEAAAQLNAAREDYSNTKQLLQFDIKDNYLTAKTSENLLKLYKEGIIPQSKMSLESAVSAYQVGSVDFLTLLDNLVTLFNFEVEYHRQLAEYNKALARLEEITGVELVE